MVKSEHKGDSRHPRHIYIALGFMAFAPVVPAHGSMFTAAHRSRLSGSKLGESKPSRSKLGESKLGESGRSENLGPVASGKDLYDK